MLNKYFLDNVNFKRRNPGDTAPRPASISIFKGGKSGIVLLILKNMTVQAVALLRQNTFFQCNQHCGDSRTEYLK